MNEEEFLNRLINKIAKEFGYDAASTLKLIVMTKDKQVEQLNKEYERIYNENCKLREEHNITDIKLLDENNRLKNIIDELEKWLKKEHENGYEVYYLMAIQDILDKLKALKEE